MADNSGPDLRLVEPNSPGQNREGTFWDKPAPTAPPVDLPRRIPRHLTDVVKFFNSVISDEGILLDLCLERATEMVEFNVKKRLFGIDQIQDGGQMHPFNLVAAASPLAIELYKNVLVSIGDRKDEYEALLQAAKEKLGGEKGPIILTP